MAISKYCFSKLAITPLFLYCKWSSIIVKTMHEDEKFKAEVKEMVDGVLELITEAE